MDPDPRKEIEVDPDPDLDPKRGLKWIRIRPNAVDPGGSGSRSETLAETKWNFLKFFLQSNNKQTSVGKVPNLYTKEDLAGIYLFNLVEFILTLTTEGWACWKRRACLREKEKLGQTKLGSRPTYIQKLSDIILEGHNRAALLLKKRYYCVVHDKTQMGKQNLLNSTVKSCRNI